ncbi:MAG: hypothetical protein IT564_11465 [Rhodospirillales bacterium]|nr:hypothetical protein [Rhodospirillales bacterium]
MGREVKRVPLDFDWPIGKVWQGFLNPYYDLLTTCEQCGGNGYSPEASLLHGIWYLSQHELKDMQALIDSVMGSDLKAFAQGFVDRAKNIELRGTRGGWSSWAMSVATPQWCYEIEQCDVQALVDADRLWDFTRIPRTPEQKQLVPEGRYWMSEPNGYIPTAQEINEWNSKGMGHDSINCWQCVKARCNMYGVPTTCSVCDGDGYVKNKTYELYKTWEEESPPTGDGWQLWETVTEGSPVSPVFATSDGLASWMAQTQGVSFETALGFVQAGWSPSFVMDSNGLHDGVDFVGNN